MGYWDKSRKYVRPLVSLYMVIGFSNLLETNSARLPTS